jgi:hypothetical protein
VTTTLSNLSPVGTAESSPGLTPDFLHAALGRSAYAAFFTESRMGLSDSTKLHRKSGSVLGYSQPILSKLILVVVLPLHQRHHCMEAQTPTLSSRAKPRDLLCALTPNKGHLCFATARRVSGLDETKRLVKTCELTPGPLFDVKAQSRSLGCARDDMWRVVTFISGRQIGWTEEKQQRSAALGMTSGGLALPCNVVVDGWVDRKSSGNLISYAPARLNLFNKIHAEKTCLSANLDSSDSQPSLRDSNWRG